jgi:hypothetical protein
MMKNLSFFAIVLTFVGLVAPSLTNAFMTPLTPTFYANPRSSPSSSRLSMAIERTYIMVRMQKVILLTLMQIAASYITFL